MISLCPVHTKDVTGREESRGEVLASPGSASATQQGTRAAQLGKSEFPRPAGCSQLLAQKRSHALLACLIAMVVYLFVHPDVEFGPVLVSRWICCHSYSSNSTTDLCLLLYCCLEIKSLSLQLMVGCLLPYPKLKTWQGHLKAQHTLLCVDLCLLFLCSQVRGYCQAA